MAGNVNGFRGGPPQGPGGRRPPPGGGPGGRPPRGPGGPGGPGGPRALHEQLTKAGLDPETATIEDIREAGITGPGGVEFGSRLEAKGVEITDGMTLSDLRGKIDELRGEIQGQRPRPGMGKDKSANDLSAKLEGTGIDESQLQELFSLAHGGDADAIAKLKELGIGPPPKPLDRTMPGTA